MAGGTLKRWLLVSYAGYPFAPNSLIPDNGLANLAAALLAAGAEVEICDFGTVSTLERFANPDVTRRLLRVWERAFARTDRTPGWTEKLRMFATLRRAEAYRDRQQRRLLEEIAVALAAKVRQRGIEAVGFKLWNGDGILGSAALAARLKTLCPGIRIFGGGPHVDIFMERILASFPAFDVLAYGEGEETIRHLAEEGADPKAYAHIPNLIHRSGKSFACTPARMIENLDALPMPVYDPEVYPAMRSGEKIRILVIDESRGCRNQCAFCIHPIKSNRSQRLKALDRLIREVESMTTRYAVHAFRFAGSCTPYDLLSSFANEVARKGLRIVYSSFAHVRHDDAADFAAMQRSGCVALFFGVESGSPRVLKLMRKGITLDQTRETMERARAAGIFTVASLIFPAPGDNAITEEETIGFVKQIRPDGVTVQPAGVMPRTDWFANAAQYGITFRDPEDYLRKTLTWRLRTLMPPALWEPLPVWIDGRSFKQVLKETGRFARRLEAEGIPTSMSDDLYLMSRCAGMDPVEFRNASRMAFLAGDAGRVRELVARINAHA